MALTDHNEKQFTVEYITNTHLSEALAGTQQDPSIHNYYQKIK